MWKQLIVDLNALPQMDLPLLIGGVEYGRMIHACAGIDVVATGGVDAQILAQGLKIWLGCTVAGSDSW